MKTIIVKTQKEIDSLPESFDEYTTIEIRSEINTWVMIRKTPSNSSVEAWESSSVEAWGSSSVEARESSRVVARESSRVEAWGSSSVEAWGSSSVEANDYSVIMTLAATVLIKKLLGSSVLTYREQKPKIEKKSKNSTVVQQKEVKHTPKSFAESMDLEITKGSVILYKSVNPETLCDFQTGKIKYQPGTVVKAPDWNPNPEIECGQGLHLSPRPELALSFHQGKLLKCQVKLKDIAVYSKSLIKVRCKQVRVLEEYDEK